MTLFSYILTVFYDFTIYLYFASFQKNIIMDFNDFIKYLVKTEQN